MLLCTAASKTFDFLHPAGVAGGGGALRGAEDRGARADAGEAQYRRGDDVRDGSVHKINHPGRGVGARDEAPRAALKTLLPCEPVVGEFKTDAREPRAVEEALQLRRHLAPPYRVDEDEMLAPLHVVEKQLQVWLEVLDDFVALMEDGVEVHLADVHAARFVPRSFRRALIGIGHRP